MGDGERMIALAHVTAPLRDRVLGLAPHHEQRRWSGAAVDSLARAERDPDQWPVTILRDGIPVGYFILHRGPGAGDLIAPTGEMLLRAFFVDATAQGRGVARSALAQLPRFTAAIDPAIRRVVLTVNVENLHAQRVYTRAGFVDTGTVVQRMSRPQLVLELLL